MAWVIEQLGGTAAVARLVRVVPSAVSNAKKEKRFPRAWHYEIDRECKRLGIELPEHFFDEMRAAS